MAVYTFRLSVEDPIDDDGADRLFEAGVDDGFLETGPSGHSVGFECEAEDFHTAMLSAIEKIEQVEAAGFEVLRMEPDVFVSAADIADRTGRTRQSISLLIRGERGPGGWPRPVAGNVRSPLWRWADVAAWFEGFDGSQQVDREETAFLAAVNEVLATRRALRPVDAVTRERLVGLVG